MLKRTVNELFGGTKIDIAHAVSLSGTIYKVWRPSPDFVEV